MHALSCGVRAGRGNAVVQVATQRAGWVSSYDVSWDDRKASWTSAYARVVKPRAGLVRRGIGVAPGQPLEHAQRRSVKPQLVSAADVTYAAIAPMCAG